MAWAAGAGGPGRRNRAVGSGGHRPGRGAARLPGGGRGRGTVFGSKMSMSRAVRMSALGSSLQVVYERWHERAVRQRDFSTNGRPGVTADESDTVAGQFAVLGILRND